VPIHASETLIIDQIDSAVDSWPTFSSEFDVPAGDGARIEGELEARRREVFG